MINLPNWLNKFRKKTTTGGGGSIPTADLAWFKLDENSGTSSADSTGNGNTLTLSSASWGVGKFGSCLSCNGSSVNAVTAANSTLQPNAGSFAISVWFKSSSNPSLLFIAGKIGANSTTVSIVITGSGAGTVAGSVDGEHGSTSSIGNSSQNWCDGNWHLAILNIDGSNQSAILASLSVDGGNFVAAGGTTIGPVDPGGAFTIGYNGTGAFFNGLIDQCRVYSRTLSNAEAAALFAE